MKRLTKQALLMLAVFGFWGVAPAYALTIDEIIELCNAGYSTGDVLEFVETLGLEEPLDSDALIRLKEDGCGSDVAVELLRIYGEAEAAEEEVFEEDYTYDYDQPSTRVYIHAGWGYPYYSYRDWGWSGWYTPWWGGTYYTWYDPWYWDYWYWPGYYFPHYYWADWHHHHRYGWRDHCWGWSSGNYHYASAHDKSTKTRGGRRYRSQSSRDGGDYRAAISRTLVEKSYRSRDEYKVRTKSYSRTDAPYPSKSEYRIKRERSSGTVPSSERTIKKGSSTTTARSYRTSQIGKAKRKDVSTSDRARKVKRSAGSSRSPSGGSPTYRSSGSSKTRQSPGTYKSGKSSSGSSSGRRGSSSGSTAKPGGSSSGSSSGDKGSTTSSSSSSGSTKSSSGSRTRRR